ncbi:G2/mitotic-specific cyclin-B2-like [Liolophura sinensis]|uniref:G2/mitotic-specific cyclin-B2-like n=1 Tax=Liolophura sinensis TaxID=3198878 RepID=UPI0031592622
MSLVRAVRHRVSGPKKNKGAEIENHALRAGARAKVFSDGGSGSRLPGSNDSLQRRALVDSGNVMGGDGGKATAKKTVFKKKVLNGVIHVPVHKRSTRKATPAAAVRRKSGSQQHVFSVSPPPQALPPVEPMDLDDLEDTIHHMLIRVPPGVVDIDANEDCFLCPEYAEDVFIYSQCLEQKWLLPIDFLTGKEVTAHMRSVLVDWLILVQDHLDLLQKTLHMTIALIDRFLDREVVELNNLQLLGITCLFIASKYHERFSPELSVLVHLTDNTYTPREIIMMERYVLRVLRFDLSFPSAIFFLDRLLLAENHTDKIETTAKYLLDLTLLSIHQIQFPPSMRAASALFMARQIWDQPGWTLGMAYYSKYSQRDLRSCMEHMARTLSKASVSKHQGARTKYSSVSRHGNISHNPRLMDVVLHF